MIILLNGNRRQENHAAAISALLSRLKATPGITLIATERYSRVIASLMPVVAAGVATWRPYDVDVKPDLMLSIGGDGTLLKTAAIAAPLCIPVLGINCGHLGYLTFDSVDNTDAIVNAIIKGDYRLERRTMLLAECPDAPGLLPRDAVALNEVAVLKRDYASMITVNAVIDDSPLTTFRADGLIVSTPTGSTGYNVSAGGALISPDAPVLSIAPVAPHSLTARPLVINDTAVIKLTPTVRGDSYLLALDGRTHDLPTGLPVYIRKAPYCLELARKRFSSFADTLREKLLWGKDGV